MKTNKFLALGLMAAIVLTSCSSNEDPAVLDSTKSEIQLKAGIGMVTRGEGVIDAGYERDLQVSFARMDNGVNTWTPDLNATRVGGSGSTPIVFATGQNFPSGVNSTTLVGYYPQKSATVAGSTLTVNYMIDGSEDIMATSEVTVQKSSPATSCTFNHMLAQLQFRCVGSSAAKDHWNNIKVSVKDVSTALDLKVTKGAAATITVNGTPNVQALAVHDCPGTLNLASDTDPATGYLMLFPTPNWGDPAGTAIKLTVTGDYSGTGAASVSKEIEIKNIAGGLKAGISNMITLVFTETGEITATADIAPWNPGANGSGTVTPGN